VVSKVSAILVLVLRILDMYGLILDPGRQCLRDSLDGLDPEWQRVWTSLNGFDPELQRVRAN
jgi:hypothetical protein